MTLPAGYVRSGGKVFDGEGRRVMVQMSGGAPLDPTFVKGGGKVVDADGREVVVIDNLAGGGGGGSLPTGGSTGQVLKKNSALDGDASWGDTAQLSNVTPTAGGVAAAGTATTAARGDHVHPMEPFANRCALGRPGAGLNNGAYVMPLGVGGNGSVRASGWQEWTPVVFDRTVSVQLGIALNVLGAAGSLIRLGLYADDPDFSNPAFGLGPGALIKEMASIAGDASTGRKLTADAVAVQAGVRYWYSLKIESSGTAPTLAAQTQGLILPTFSFSNPALCFSYSRGGVPTGPLLSYAATVTAAGGSIQGSAQGLAPLFSAI